MGDSWKREDFHRRHYTIAGEDLDNAKQIELIIRVDGKDVVHMKQTCEPGLVAFVSKPGEQGFDVELVTHGAFRFTDIRTPTGAPTEDVLPWQLSALGFPGET